jgi:leucyl aminopeptidase (aminopeptidase T)
MTEVFDRFSILLALTELSSTAPLKVAARGHGFRAATMPGFSAAMIPALRLDYGEVDRRVSILKSLLDRATGADLLFQHPRGEDRLHLDLRFRTGHASGGLIPKRGTAANLPSGEAYIVPYEGERPGEPSRSSGILPVQFDKEVVRYRVEDNRAVEVLSSGPESSREAALLAVEPAYANIAELGLGVLAAFGVQPVGAILLDEKLGLHIAFGRSDHFGGQVGPSAFSSPEAVVHIDRVYVPHTQPNVRPERVHLALDDGTTLELMRDGEYGPVF